MARYADFDPATKTVEYFHEEDGNLIVAQEQDITDIVEQNKALHAAVDERAKYGEFQRVASIPINVFMELQRTGVARDDRAFKRWLDDRDNSVFRTRPGKLSR